MFHYNIFIHLCNVFLKYSSPDIVSCHPPPPTDPFLFPNTFPRSTLITICVCGMGLISLVVYVLGCLQEFGHHSNRCTTEESIFPIPINHYLQRVYNYFLFEKHDLFLNKQF